MKILLLTELYLPIINGVVTSTSNLYNALIANGHDVRVLALDKEKSIQGNIYYNKALSLDKVYPNAFVSPILDKEIFEDILAWKPDILHTQREFSTLSYAKKISKKLDIPIVHTYHTSYEDYTHYIGIPKMFDPKFVSFVLKVLLSKVSAIIAPTKKIDDMLQAYKINKKIAIIPTGIDLSFPTLEQNEIDLLKRTLNISENNKVFLSLGRIAKEKNIETILEYIEKIENKDWILVICGGGPYLEVLKTKAKELNIEDKVRFTGMVDREDTYKYYQMADIFVSASTSETQGLTYIEALSNGTPLLCKYDTCLNEVLLPTKNGYFFNTFDEFQENAIKLINEVQNENIASQIRQSVEKYSTINFALEVAKIYQDVLNEEH